MTEPDDLDEVRILREAWGWPEPPSAAAHDGARAALLERAARQGQPAGRPVSRRRLRWGMLGATVTAAALALVLVLAQPGFGPDAPAPSVDAVGDIPGTGGETGAARSPGQEVLLAAATTAAEQPAGEGEYWYLQEELDFEYHEEQGWPNPQTLQTWTARDGRLWSGNLDDDVVYLFQDHPGYQLARSLLTYQELLELPTDPAQLTARITGSFTDPTGWEEVGQAPGLEVPEAPAQGEVAFELTYLLYRFPAPPAVRAAAYAALAAMPEVESLGPVDGGEQLRIAIEPMSEDKFPDGEVPDGLDHIMLVVDPATSALVSWTNYQGTTRILTAEWTDRPPPVE